MNKMMFVIVMAILSITGCATQKEWGAVNGSRSAGVITLAYEYGEFEKPVLQEGQGQQLAQQKCSAWGYSNAEAFGTTEKTCIEYNQYGCVRYRVTAEFQCTGSSVK